MRTSKIAANLIGKRPPGTKPSTGGRPKGRFVMPSWLLILIVGVLLLVFGIAVEAAKFLIWLGIIVLVVSLIMGLVGRGRRSTV